MIDDTGKADDEDLVHSDPDLRSDGGEITTENSSVDRSTKRCLPGSISTAETPTIQEAQRAETDQDQLRPSERSASSPTDEPENGIEKPSEVLDGSEIFSDVVDPNEVLDFYLEANPWGVQPGTVKSYRSRLRYFRGFCEERELDDLRDLLPSHTDEFHNFLREQPQLGSRKTVKDCLATLRKFLRYCERREVIERGFHEFVILPDLSDKEGIDETWLPRDEAKEVVEYLATFEPFTKEHVVWVLLTETGIRQSTLYAFDLGDYHSEERYIEAVNREETGTRLKNGDGSEREISLSSDACQILDGYLQAKRVGVRDEHGRQPLLTTHKGRLHKSTIRKYGYAWSRPCAIGKDCPVGEDPDTCPAAQTHNDAYKCPESVSPHPIRKGYITHPRANGIPTGDVISERCDVDPDTIEKWYDMCMESERREARRSYVEGL